MRDLENISFPKMESIAVIGNYLPRKCGIATFTTDLVESLSKKDYDCKAIAINDKPEGYDYPPEVRFEINQDKLADYHTAANFLNTTEVDMVLLQHEFGIFGGDAGQHILTLLNDLDIPVVTTLHTVLTEPTKKQERVMRRIAGLSDELVVMSKNATEILHAHYDIPKDKISFIPHGIPDMPFVDPNYYKDQFNLLGQKVMLTFGLLSENKGIEYVIKGLPKVVERFPDVTYIVLGATHPHVLESEGEKYRRKLESLVEKLDLEDNVEFVDDFVPFEKLCEYLAATDIYITPYVQEQQITSGTLAYAAGTGKAVISTPYWYAQEILSDGRGKLVPFKDEEAMADAMKVLLENDMVRHQMRKRSYDFNREATWPEVARQYIDICKGIKSDYTREPKFTNGSHASCQNGRENPLPDVNIDHIKRLTDDTGLLQHATFTIPNRNHGYCADDNARGLIFAIKAQQLSSITVEQKQNLADFSNRYLSFLFHAYDDKTGRFRNFMSYSRKWRNLKGSQDAHGRALWALGETIAFSEESDIVSLAITLFMRALPAVESFDSPRATAFTILGIDAYLKEFEGDSKARRIYRLLAERIFSQFKDRATEDWPWLEDIVAYSNGKLPHALILAGNTLERDDMLKQGTQALDWLLTIQTSRGYISPIGNQGWYERDKYKARFDQQPIEAHCLLHACADVHKVTGDTYWLKEAKKCFNWFMGDNDLGQPIYDRKTGGCRDGLHVDSINQNQGAESTLAWLLSLVEVYQLANEKRAGAHPLAAYSEIGTKN